MKQLRKEVALILSLWAICMISLLGVRFIKHRRTIPNSFPNEAADLYSGLQAPLKKDIDRLDSAIIKLSDKKLYLIGLGFELDEQNLFRQSKLARRMINIQIADSLLLERQMMLRESLKTLNNAEKKCYADGHGAVLFRDGSYYFVFDPMIYQEYVKKYGTKCVSCEEIKKAAQQKRR